MYVLWVYNMYMVMPYVTYPMVPEGGVKQTHYTPPSCIMFQFYTRMVSVTIPSLWAQFVCDAFQKFLFCVLSSKRRSCIYVRVELHHHNTYRCPRSSAAVKTIDSVSIPALRSLVTWHNAMSTMTTVDRHNTPNSIYMTPSPRGVPWLMLIWEEIGGRWLR